MIEETPSPFMLKHPSKVDTRITGIPLTLATRCEGQDV